MLFLVKKGHIFVNSGQAALARKQLERRLAPLRQMTLVAPSRGWIKAIRESLGMTARQLAARMGVAPSRIPTIEKAEVTGGTTVRTLRQAAAAMNCAFVYAFVPIEPLDDILRERAMQKARKNVVRLDHTMRLENQAVLKSDLDAEEQRTVDLIVSGSLRGLWDEGGHRA
ncbi:MAG TPA: mobile mystery protein A [Candidatus Aquilonibacter sp.]